MLPPQARMSFCHPLFRQNPPHSPEVWQEAQTKWQEAINLLQQISPDAFVASEAVEKLDLYRINYQAVTTQLERENREINNE